MKVEPEIYSALSVLNVKNNRVNKPLSENIVTLVYLCALQHI